MTQASTENPTEETEIPVTDETEVSKTDATESTSSNDETTTESSVTTEMTQASTENPTEETEIPVTGATEIPETEETEETEETDGTKETEKTEETGGTRQAWGPIKKSLFSQLSNFANENKPAVLGGLALLLIILFIAFSMLAAKGKPGRRSASNRPRPHQGPVHRQPPKGRPKIKKLEPLASLEASSKYKKGSPKEPPKKSAQTKSKRSQPKQTKSKSLTKSIDSSKKSSASNKSASSAQSNKGASSVQSNKIVSSKGPKRGADIGSTKRLPPQKRI